MNTKIKLLFGVLALALMLGLNSRHALDGYGMKSGNLHINVLAADSTSNSSNNSSSSAGSDSTKTTYQEGKKTITQTILKTDEAGYSWDVGVKAWFFEGKISKTSPKTSYTETTSVEIKCCREKGDKDSCAYESC